MRLNSQRRIGDNMATQNVAKMSSNCRIDKQNDGVTTRNACSDLRHVLQRKLQDVKLGKVGFEMSRESEKIIWLECAKH